MSHPGPRTLPVERLPDCPPGFACGWHGVCSSCGETIHLGPIETSPGFGPVDEAMARAVILGDPPRCYECRT